MKIVIIVPVKLRSQRLPGKMLLPLGKKKLVQHLFDTLRDLKNDLVVDIYCYCSDEDIIQYLPDNIKFLKRSKDLDSNETLGIDIYKSFSKEIKADIYGLCHATSPFIKKESIIKGFDKVINENYDSAFACSRIQTCVWFEDKPLNYDLYNIPNTQNIKPIFWETNAFYIFKQDVLENHSRVIGFNSYMVETDRVESVDIDNKEDYELACKIVF